MRISWDDYFLNIAKAVSLRATCIRRSYGAVIVKNHIIISTGYNGSARGEVNCCDIGECERNRLNIPSGERYELSKAIHAEANAIINGDPNRMIGSTIYIYGINPDGSEAEGKPCLMCDRMIKNAGIGRIVGNNFEKKIPFKF